jgi:hypothetical protein
MEFTTFVAIWANTVTLLAIYLFGTSWLLQNVPCRIKEAVRLQLGESKTEFDKIARGNSFTKFRYAMYALIAQCLHLACIYYY